MTNHFDVPIDDLELSVRSTNALKSAGITTLGAIIQALADPSKPLHKIPQLGEKSRRELRETVAYYQIAKDQSAATRKPLPSEHVETCVRAAAQITSGFVGPETGEAMGLIFKDVYKAIVEAVVDSL